MSDYLLDHGSRETAQSEPLRDDQVPNSAGGFVWAVDDWTRLRRFLILGSEGGSYYADERQLTGQNVKCVKACLAEDGPRVVALVVSVSQSGAAPRNDPALFVLASAISLGDKATKRAAAEALPLVARIGTHLYHFVAYAETMRGWGRTLRWAVENWYAQNPEQLALQAVKYRQRDGWSHRDLLRLAHPVTANAETAAIFDWICHRDKTVEGATIATLSDTDTGRMLQGFENAQRANTSAETASLVREYRLPREALQPDHLVDALVWSALLANGMPMTAMVRNLATMTRNGTLKNAVNLQAVVDKLLDPEAIAGSRIHPLALLVALRTYASGRGFRGTAEWTPLVDVIDALDEAFYLAFDNVAPTGKRFLLGLDVSGSMGSGNVAGSPLTPREAAVAMALVTLHAEKHVHVMGFTGGFVPLPLSRRQRLDDAVRSVEHLGFDRTDCAQPMLYALGNHLDVDAFVIYTDSETWAGRTHPKQALDTYRSMFVHDARSVVVGMVSNGFTIADPSDPGMLDVVGMDASTPALISEFVAGRL